MAGVYLYRNISEHSRPEGFGNAMFVFN